MKGLIILFVVGVAACGVIVWLTQWGMSDPGIGVALAFGNPDEGTIEMHVAIDMGMPRRERPRANIKGTLLWDEWVADHFDLRDGNGQPVEITRIGYSMLIPEQKVGGAPEFYLKAVLQGGVSYTFDYIARKADAHLYRRTFVAPADTQQMKRWNFEPTERGGA